MVTWGTSEITGYYKVWAGGLLTKVGGAGQIRVFRETIIDLQLALGWSELTSQSDLGWEWDNL